MKKLWILGLVTIFLSAYSMASAAPVGNPAKPILEKGNTSFKVGTELDFVTQRDLDVSGEDVAIENLNWYGAKISYVLADKVEPYVLLGAANGKFSDKYSGVDLKLETETAFAWGLGATVLLKEFDNGIRLGIDAKYRQVEPDINKLTLNNVEYTIPSGSVTNVSAEYKEWQVALGISKELGQFVPYGGIKYNDVEASLKTTISGTTYTTDNINSDGVVGIFVGCDFLPTKNLSIGVEGRFIDETAFTVSANYRF